MCFFRSWQTFRAPPGYPGKIPGYPAKKVWFPWYRGTYRTFWPCPLHVEDPSPPENIWTQKFGFVLFFVPDFLGIPGFFWKFRPFLIFFGLWKPAIPYATNPCPHSVPAKTKRELAKGRKRKKAINIKSSQEFTKIGPPSLGPPPVTNFFYVRLLGYPKFIYVRNVVHLEIKGKTHNIKKALDPHPRGCQENLRYNFCGFFNSVQTRCIVKGEAQKSPLFWRFSESFDFLRIACSLGIPKENLQIQKTLIFTNTPCKSTCLYNAPSMHTVDFSALKGSFWQTRAHWLAGFFACPHPTPTLPATFLFFSFLFPQGNHPPPPTWTRPQTPPTPGYQ